MSMMGISLESKRVSRQYIRKHIPKCVTDELPAAVDGGIVMSPFVYMPDLVALVLEFFSLHKCNTLVWHDGMDENDLWVKFVGDHGGKSLKFSLQLLNVSHPNSCKNTIPLCLFSAKDSAANLESALGMYQEQLEKLQATAWTDKAGSEKHIQTFLCGDYEFLTTMFGITGANGVHPCLFCHTDKTTIKKVLTVPPKVRTLDTLHDCHQSFLRDGGHLKKAKSL